ncbi:MAG: hypothetical protein IT350_20360 [Deltaproteobacteria bacterium]|nr:hypothetical protein [Deltaproteobacteria bacterium]
MIGNPETIALRAFNAPIWIRVVALPLALVLLLIPACDCGSSATSDGANSDDDDVVADDDTSADDDGDDDAGSTTTTTPTTSTTGGTVTTTTATSPSTTTTTIPGSGTACDPYRYTAAEGPDVPDFGPWPEYTIGAITYRQYIAGSAGVGRNAVALDADGRAWVFGMVGRSFDAYIFDDDGSVEREIVDPAGGLNSEVNRDGSGAFHVVYTNTNANEIRYATNTSGEWVQTVILAVPEGGVVFGSAREPNGTIHVAYTRLENDTTGLIYFRWREGSIEALEQAQEPEEDNWLWGVSLALEPVPDSVES